MKTGNRLPAGAQPIVTKDGIEYMVTYFGTTKQSPETDRVKMISLYGEGPHGRKDVWLNASEVGMDDENATLLGGKHQCCECGKMTSHRAESLERGGLVWMCSKCDHEDRDAL